MPPNPRLPIVNGDDGIWGNILVQYLEEQHVNTGGTNGAVGNGGHQNVTIIAGTSALAPLTLTSGTSLATPAAGSLEFTTDNLYFTITTGTVRETIAMYNDASGTRGSLYYRDSTSGPLIPLPLGTSGQYLSSNGTIPAWNNLVYANATKTSGYSISATDCVIFANATTASVAIQLPLASSVPGYQFTIKRIDNNYPTYSVTVTNSGSDTIDGATSGTITLNLQYTSITVISNGSLWYII